MVFWMAALLADLKVALWAALMVVQMADVMAV
jgi:hypothetical protein